MITRRTVVGSAEEVGEHRDRGARAVLVDGVAATRQDGGGRVRNASGQPIRLRRRQPGVRATPEDQGFRGHKVQSGIGEAVVQVPPQREEALAIVGAGEGASPFVDHLVGDEVLVMEGATRTQCGATVVP